MSCRCGARCDSDLVSLLDCVWSYCLTVGGRYQRRECVASHEVNGHPYVSDIATLTYVRRIYCRVNDK